jgi:hypothetical protein
MNIFILEDVDARKDMMVNMLKKTFTGVNILSTNTAEEAKLVLELGMPGWENEPWDVISLDHDLGGMTYVDSEDPDTGYQAAKFIKEHKIPYKKCLIHSMNFAGAMKMQAVLKDSIYLPIIMWTPENLRFAVGNS